MGNFQLIVDPCRVIINYKGSYIGTINAVSDPHNKKIILVDNDGNGSSLSRISDKYLSVVEIKRKCYSLEQRNTIEGSIKQDFCYGKTSNFINYHVIKSLEAIFPDITTLYCKIRRQLSPKIKKEFFYKFFRGISYQTEKYFLADLHKYKFLQAYLSHQNFIEISNNWRDSIIQCNRVTNRRLFNKQIDGWKWMYYTNFFGGLDKLKEPITNRTKLFFTKFILHNDASSIIINSDVKDIRKAFKIFKTQQLDTKISLRSISGCQRFVQFIDDYVANAASVKNRNIKNIAIEAVRWHTDILKDRNNRWLLGKPGETTVPTLPNLPENKSIKPLTTLQDIVSEGNKMGHCVASYTRNAYEGQVFLYHIDYEGEAATLAVSKGHDGTLFVQQSYGPGNRINSASTYASRWFSRELAKLNNRNKPLNVRTEPAQEEMESLAF